MGSLLAPADGLWPLAKVFFSFWLEKCLFLHIVSKGQWRQQKKLLSHGIQRVPSGLIVAEGTKFSKVDIKYLVMKGTPRVPSCTR